MQSAGLEKAISLLGSQAALAKTIGVKRQAVNAWLNKRTLVPVKHCPAIEKATQGSVTCELLRPDFDWSVVRGT